MAKVTSKYQVTVPKTIAEKYASQPGDEIAWVPAGDVIRVIPAGRVTSSDGRESKLHWFDQATERHRRRTAARKIEARGGRGWSRDELYGRGRAR